jgi:hypothetical protein
VVTALLDMARTWARRARGEDREVLAQRIASLPLSWLLFAVLDGRVDDKEVTRRLGRAKHVREIERALAEWPSALR